MDKEIRYSVHKPTLTSIITLQQFHYFKVYLPHVGHYFTTQTEWNRNYPMALKIYGEGTGSLAIRKAIQAEHSILYSNREMRLGTKKGSIPTSAPNAFFDLLEEFKDGGSINQKQELELYTYVLMPESLRFSRTGSKMTNDFSSKHALHAGASPTVSFAGEFWIQVEKNEKVLYVDNNSGTFGPSKSGLVRMKSLLEDTFGIKVVTLDYQDEVWKEIQLEFN
jgi:hypothetical protein